jgi:hypothetical protein
MHSFSFLTDRAVLSLLKFRSMDLLGRLTCSTSGIKNDSIARAFPG